MREKKPNSTVLSHYTLFGGIVLSLRIAGIGPHTELLCSSPLISAVHFIMGVEGGETHGQR